MHVLCFTFCSMESFINHSMAVLTKNVAVHQARGTVVLGLVTKRDRHE